MGKKRGQKHHSPQQQKPSPAAPVVEVVPIAAEIAAVADEIQTPVKPSVDELPVESPSTGDADETREEEVKPREEETSVQPKQEDENELSPGGESPQGKTKDVAEEAAAVAAIEAPAAAEQAAQAAPVTPPSQQAATMEPPVEHLHSPASTVQPEPLLPSDAEDASRKTTPAAEGEEKLQEKIVKIVSDLSEQPVVQFVAVIVEKILVALLVFAIGLYSRVLTTKLYASAKKQFDEQVGAKYLKDVVVGDLVNQGLDKAAGVVTPLGLFDTKTLQGKAWAFAVSTGKEIIADATKQADKQKKD